MKALVAVVDYPNNEGKVSLMYVHTRNKYYMEHGIEVVVLNFATQKDYIFDGIKVITLNSYRNMREKYDVLICHAANLRNHYAFLKKYGNNFSSFIFFFHGHEVLRSRKVYSKPYDYLKYSLKTRLSFVFKDFYDIYKLKVWRKYYLKNVNKSNYVFVSKWMLNEFLKWTKIPYSSIEEKTSITYNCIGKAFEEAVYDPEAEKIYDFVTVRNNIDGSKYCVDLVNNIAKKFPEYRFLLVGKGQMFEYYEKASNLEWRNQTMNHKEIIECLNQSRCALMPTRTDAQGLMMCEMASTGIPLLTSDIPVCHEVFDGFQNVEFIDNENAFDMFIEKYEKLKKNIPFEKNTKYYNSNTSRIETDLLFSIYKGNIQ